MPMPQGRPAGMRTDRRGPAGAQRQAGLSEKRASKQRREGRRTFQTEGTARTKALGGGRIPRPAARLSEGWSVRDQGRVAAGEGGEGG